MITRGDTSRLVVAVAVIARVTSRIFLGRFTEFAACDTFEKKIKKKKKKNKVTRQSETPRRPVTDIQHAGPLIPGRAISLHLSLMELAIALSLVICIPDD